MGKTTISGLFSACVTRASFSKALIMAQVQLLPFEVGTCNLNGEWLTKAVFALGTSAYQPVILLVEFVEIVVQFADRDHSLALVLVDLHVESPLGNARYHTVIHLTHLVSHKFHLLILDGIAFGIGSHLLHVGRVLALHLQL